MKNLTKLIAATSVAIFATIVMSTQTFAATSVDVYCDGNDDQEKIAAVLDDDVIINIHGECVLTDWLVIDGMSNVVIEGNNSTITVSLASYDEEADIAIIGLMIANGSVVINDVNLVLDSTMRGNALAFYVAASDLHLNNVVVDGFGSAMLVLGEPIAEGSRVIANGFVASNVRGTVDSLFGPVNVAIGTAGGGNVINWVSGWSDAEWAVALSFMGVPDIATENYMVDSRVLLEGDFVMFWDDGFMVFGTINPVNQLVNCGFPVGSQWDICTETGGGDGENGSDNGNEIEAPGTGIGSINTTILIVTSLLIIGCGAMATKRARL